MKRIAKILGALGLMGCAVMNIPFAVADDSVATTDDSGFYVGGSIGQSNAKIDDARIISNLLGAGATTTSIVDDNRGLGYKLFGGYQYNNYLSIEGGYFDLGQFGYTATTTAPNGTLTGKLKLKGGNLDLLGTWPLTENFSALGRVGVIYAQVRDNFTTTGGLSVTNPNPSKNNWNYKFGAGLQYDLTESLSIRAEAERYHIKDAIGNPGDIDLFSGGLVYRFGKSSASAMREETPEPQPVVVAPKEVPLKKVTFSTDSLFVFNSTKINPAGKQGLDELAEDLKHTNFNIIFVTGHTDRIGSKAFNMELSRGRAEAVKAYLVDTAGIPVGKIAIRGAAESEPVTRPGECKGNLTKNTPNDTARKLKACLAPDRRVEVEVHHATEKRK